MPSDTDDDEEDIIQEGRSLFSALESILMHDTDMTFLVSYRYRQTQTQNKTKLKTKNVPSATDDDNDDDDIAQEERRSIFSAPCVAPFSTVSRRHKQTQNKKDKRRMCLVPHMMKTT